ncbi:hypothetical protein GC176_08610 [bacterium]|nr:hypothetical protein [bacterium]
MKRLTPRQPRSRRRGTTLTEVLMSLMVMSIGVVSLATLFPISAARVLEATNLTNATVLRFNAEGIIDSFPAMIHQPDGDAIDTVTNRYTDESGRPLQVDPLGFWERYQEIDLFDDGTVNQSPSLTDPQLILYEYNRPTTIAWPYKMDSSGRVRQTRFLGENPSNIRLFPTIDVARAITTLPDTATDYGDGFPDPAGTNTAAYALNGSNRIIGLVLPTQINLAALTLATTDPNYQAPSLYQATIFDKSGDYSEVRRLNTVTAVGGGQYAITWEEDLNQDGDTTDAGEDRALPLRFTTDSSGIPNVGLVRIQQPVSDYTWMLTVRKRTTYGPANVDVVVFRKRDFSQLSDQLYIGELRRFNLGLDGAPGKAGFDDNFDGSTDEVAEIGYPSSPNVPFALRSDDEPNNRVLVDWTPNATNGYLTTPLAPKIRRGGFLYDPQNGLWYRIRGTDESPFNPATSTIVVLEESIVRDNTEDRNGNGVLDPGEDTNANNTLDRGGVIIPDGVVAVFPLETKLP